MSTSQKPAACTNDAPKSKKVDNFLSTMALEDDPSDARCLDLTIEVTPYFSVRNYCCCYLSYIRAPLLGGAYCLKCHSTSGSKVFSLR